MDNKGWDGWMTSLTQWTWVSPNSRRWWRTGKPGMLQPMGSQRVRHDWATEQKQVNSGPHMTHVHKKMWEALIYMMIRLKGGTSYKRFCLESSTEPALHISPHVFLNYSSLFCCCCYFLNLCIYIYIYILAARDLHCCTQAFSSYGDQGFLTVVAPPVEHGL